jgi:hypothetical protein
MENCEHGIPDDQDCIECVRKELSSAKAELERVRCDLNLQKQATKSEARWAKVYFDENKELRKKLEETGK